MPTSPSASSPPTSVSSGRRLERRRIALLTAAHRLSELAELADEPRHLPEMLAGALDGLALAEAQGLA